MDKSWVLLDRRSPEYFAGMTLFLDAFARVAPINEIICPCIKCKNRESYDRKTIEQHLVVKGMWSYYMNSWWKYHGESYADYRGQMELDNNEGGEINGIQEFLNETFVQPTIGENVGLSSQPHIFEGPTPEAERFYKLLEDANKEVYLGCKKFKKLDAVVKLYQIKYLGGWSDNSFSWLLEYIKELLPEGECLPDSFYQTKKLISELGLTYEKIDACPRDCMLFWKDRSNLTVCSHCGASRYIQKECGSSSKQVSEKVLRYSPLIPRLQRLYMSKHTAVHMRWHATECPKDELMRHPSYSPAWKHLDSKYPEFGSEIRNVRLGLASDEFNPDMVQILIWCLILKVMVDHQYTDHMEAYAHLQSQFMELESKYQEQQEQTQVQQAQTQAQLLQTQQELAMLKQMIQSQQSTPPPQASSQPLQQPPFQMLSYPPQMYWPQQQMYPQMQHYQPQPAYPTTGLTGLLMGDASILETDLLNQVRASSNQSSHGSE